MPNNITFAVNQASLNPSIYPTLNSVINVLDRFDETLLRVVGHTDSTGSDSYNQQLSLRRAQSVSGYLLRSQKISTERLIVAGYGEKHPRADNRTAEGRAQNRRVELLIEPNS